MSKPEPNDAESYFLAGHEFFEGAYELAFKDRLHICCAFLTAQSLECLLKAFLSHNGLSEKDLAKKPFGHDLEHWWSESIKRGFPFEMPDWCPILNAGHRSLKYRYPMKLRGHSLPDTTFLYEQLRAILEWIQSHIGVDRLNTPGS